MINILFRLKNEAILSFKLKKFILKMLISFTTYENSFDH